MPVKQKSRELAAKTEERASAETKKAPDLDS